VTSRYRRAARLFGTLGALFLVGRLLAPATANAACILLSGYPDGASLENVELPGTNSRFSLVYMHSVTRTPVLEHYYVDGAQIVQTEMEFEQYGPGLPTQADAGGTIAVRNGRLVATMTRRFSSIPMRVNADQLPRLVFESGTRDLAQWGNRALVLAVAARCPGTS
jgi:hypothetical protein